VGFEMMLFSLIFLLAIFGIFFYIISQNRDLRKRIFEIEKEQDLIKKNLVDLDLLINGKTYEGESRKYGGLEGYGGTTGKVDYLDKKVDSLIDVLNLKLMDIGKRLNAQDMLFGSSLYSEVQAKQFESDSKR
jgi:hypothetical protein